MAQKHEKVHRIEVGTAKNSIEFAFIIAMANFQIN